MLMVKGLPFSMGRVVVAATTAVLVLTMAELPTAAASSMGTVSTGVKSAMLSGDVFGQGPPRRINKVKQGRDRQRAAPCVQSEI